MENVSVVLCTFNGEKYLRQQLDSILCQTYPLYEVIIQDDGSTDNTESIISEYLSGHDNISFYKNESVHGINSNFYSAMQRAKGDYIAICDQDDIWEKDKIALQIASIGNKLMCAGRSKPFSEDGSFVYYDIRMPNVTLLRMLYCAEIAGHTMLIRRDLLDLLPRECRVVKNRCYDIVLSVLAAAYDSIVFLDKVLVHQRRYVTANTYTSTEDCLPTPNNAWHMLSWAIKKYMRIKELSKPVYRDWEEFLSCLNTNHEICREGIRMMHFQQSTRVVDTFRLVWLCLCHREEILHTRGHMPYNALRAVLFPLTSCYYQRSLILSEK